MKLGQLNAAIDAAPKVYVRTRFGKIAFEKGSVKAALKAHFNGQRAVETTYHLDDEFCLTPEHSVPV
jgi:hypothetical protein